MRDFENTEMLEIKTETSSINLLVVDDDISICEVIQQYFQEKGFGCQIAFNSQNALKMLETESFDLVITDIKMPRDGGIYLLKEIKKHYPDTAVIMMTGVHDTLQAVECLKMGAYDYIPKPFDMQEMNVSVQRAIERRNLLQEREMYRFKLENKVRERTLELVNAYDEIESTYHKTLEVLVSALDLRERSTAGHSKRAVEYSRLLAIEMGIRGNKLINIIRGALLHDVGKIGITDRILLKPGPLSKEEWEIMHRHTIYGYQMLSEIKFLQKSLDIVLYHHERWDGNGYPSGLKGEEIPIGARMFAVVDAFDAITSKRVYRDPKSFEEAHQILMDHAHSQFDPHVVEKFINIPIEKLKRVFHISLLKSQDKFSTNPFES